MNRKLLNADRLEEEIQQDKKFIQKAKKKVRRAQGFFARKNAKRALSSLEDGADLVKAETRTAKSMKKRDGG